METINLFVKISIVALIATIVFYITIEVFKAIKQNKNQKRVYKRKLDIIRALEMYWLNNLEESNSQITPNEIKEMNLISEICKDIDEIKFRIVLEKSKIDYCSKYYKIISETKYAESQMEIALKAKHLIKK